MILGSKAYASDVIQSDSPFSPVGKFGDLSPQTALAAEIAETERLERAAGGLSESTDTQPPAKVETGTLNGVHYRIDYRYGTGSFAGKPENTEDPTDRTNSYWTVSCRRDLMNDAPVCYLQTNHLSITAHPESRISIRIGKNHFPGSSAAIRIDKGIPYVTSPGSDGIFSSVESSEIIKSMSNTDTITTRFMEWPEESWVDEQWVLFGFDEAYRFALWAVDRLR